MALTNSHGAVLYPDADSFLGGPDESDCFGSFGEGCGSPEAALWFAVIERAFMDIGKTMAGAGNRTKNTGKIGTPEWRERVRARQVAQAWFTSEESREDFETVCDFAGVSADVVKALAFEVLRDSQNLWFEEDAMLTRLSKNRRMPENQRLAAE